MLHDRRECSMIYLTGDTHSDFNRFSRNAFPEQENLTKDDYVMIAGDFGGVWFAADDREHQKSECYMLDELNARSFTTLFVPGNHENYARLMSDEFPLIEWHGGLVRQIRPSILMLMRGEMYEIDGARFFAFGGASSHDAYEGLLDGNDPDWRMQAAKMRREGKRFFRVKGISWWPEELPSEEEMAHGLETLEKNGWKTDFVIPHCAPTSIQDKMGFPWEDRLNRYLEEIHSKLDYKYWLFGHYHSNLKVTPKDILIYEQIIRIR